MFKFFIEGELPSLNEYTGANRSNRYKGGKVKEKTTLRCFTEANNALKDAKVRPNKQRLHDLTLNWKVKNNMKDSDNVFFAVKFILDGMETAGMIERDSRKYIRNISHTIETDKKNQGVTVILTEVGEL